MLLLLVQKKHREKKSFSGCHEDRKDHSVLRKGIDLLISIRYFFKSGFELQLERVL